MERGVPGVTATPYSTLPSKGSSQSCPEPGGGQDPMSLHAVRECWGINHTRRKECCSSSEQVAANLVQSQQGRTRSIGWQLFQPFCHRRPPRVLWRGQRLTTVSKRYELVMSMYVDIDADILLSFSYWMALR